jgi:hypothetical protein
MIANLSVASAGTEMVPGLQLGSLDGAPSCVLKRGIRIGRAILPGQQSFQETTLLAAAPDLR